MRWTCQPTTSAPRSTRRPCSRAYWRATMPPRKPSTHPTMSDLALALANRRTDPVQTVSLTRNAKGDVQIAVEVNGPDLKACGKQAETEFNRLAKVFPLSSAQK